MGAERESPGRRRIEGRGADTCQYTIRTATVGTDCLATAKEGGERYRLTPSLRRNSGHAASTCVARSQSSPFNCTSRLIWMKDTFSRREIDASAPLEGRTTWVSGPGWAGWSCGADARSDFFPTNHYPVPRAYIPPPMPPPPKPLVVPPTPFFGGMSQTPDEIYNKTHPVVVHRPGPT
jgi:hypothetical protein